MWVSFSPMKKAELILVSMPGTGHFYPMIEFGKRLINLDHRISTISILSMKLPCTQNTVTSVPGIQLISLPEIQDFSSEDDIPNVISKTIPVFSKTIRDLVSSSSSHGHVAGLILDFLYVDLIDIGHEVNLPSYIFMPSNFGFMGYLQYLAESNGSSGEEELLIPALADLVPVKFPPPPETLVKVAKRMHEAKGILVNSFPELEPYAAEHFLQGRYHSHVYPVGPILNLSGGRALAQYKKTMKWLEEQPDSSVLLLCFGSMGFFSAQQITEIAEALVLVGFRFIWAIRTNMAGELHELLPEGFIERTKGRGIVCGWAPQVEILSHKATGGFVSHCGWNSIQESLWYGVPIATWPMYAEQQLNAYKMVKEMGLAVEIRLDYVAEIVSADKIAIAIRSLMDIDNPIRKKVQKISAAARKAVDDGGSSMVATREFISDVLGDHS